jgi:hypothetical protein
MEPALDVIQRALQGQQGARSFLERTTSVYVLDVTDSANPKTYGCWNYIHQALNEVERYEARQTPISLVSHVRLLATMALRVARRSLSGDRALVATCIANAAEYRGSDSQSDWLIELNYELREIVMGRIAAMAFDFNFYRNNGGAGSPSAFSDRVVLDTFCAILSANAVSSGPLAIHHFALEWVVPSARSIPPFALVCVVHHLALEGMRKSAPAGTKDTLQDLSVSVVSAVLTPTLQEVVIDDKGGDSIVPANKDTRNAVAAKILLALQAWCDATDLSLPQIRHICTKVGVSHAIMSVRMHSCLHTFICDCARVYTCMFICFAGFTTVSHCLCLSD